MNIPNLSVEEPLRVMEGERFLLKCESDRAYETIYWRGEIITTNNNTIAIERIHKNYSGLYECIASGENRYTSKRINVQVLFPPSNPVIEGETTGIYGEEVTLKCSSDSLPKPLYEWRRENKSGIVLSHSHTLQTTIEKGVSAIVCVVTSVMNTTLGESKTERATLEIVIHGNKKTNIEGIFNLNGDNVREGDDIYLFCLVSGKPAPEVWWTKVENNSFFFEGLRLVEHKVDKDFTGDYICHARNTVLSVNKTSITTEVTKSISIQVIKSHLPKTISSLSSKEIILISGNVIGWAIIIIILTVYIALHVKRKSKKISHDQRLRESRIEAHEYSSIQNMPELYISQSRLPEHIYNDHIGHRSCNMIGQEAEVINEQSDLYLKPIYSFNQNNNRNRI